MAVVRKEQCRSPKTIDEVSLESGSDTDGGCEVEYMEKAKKECDEMCDIVLGEQHGDPFADEEARVETLREVNTIGELDEGWYEDIPESLGLDEVCTNMDGRI